MGCGASFGVNLLFDWRLLGAWDQHKYMHYSYMDHKIDLESNAFALYW